MQLSVAFLNSGCSCLLGLAEAVLRQSTFQETVEAEIITSARESNEEPSSAGLSHAARSGLRRCLAAWLVRRGRPGEDLPCGSACCCKQGQRHVAEQGVQMQGRDWSFI